MTESVPTGFEILSPEALLERIRALAPDERWLGILTGPRGAGKTTWCAALARVARARGLSVAGVLSPATFAPRTPGGDPIKVRIDLLDLATGQARELATPADPALEGHGMRWHFEAETIAWGNARLEAGGPADLWIIDELGPLEITHARGLTAALDRLDSGCYRAAVVVIRPELLAWACARWPAAAVLTVPAWRPPA